MESQVSLDSERYTHLENMSIQGKDPGVASSAPDCVEPKQPEKRPTRQWAAWTRQEEESFFTALRQVGKNFEKITRHVKSKNKDQVRHYYYRLVRRMNKLLGPGLCLDAKNSKDTNAAMLRWWSLLEKYSCKASKLHLKPRRFKIFIDALANQLLKDRRKNVRKRSSQGDSGSLTAPSIISNQNRGSGHDARTVKLVFVDSQNLQKLGGGKGSLKRNVNMGVIRSNNKGDSAVMKPTRQRRKPAAYKKWEKAAIAGVSLVADAAEHLERTATDKEIEDGQVMAGQKFLDPVEKVMPPLPASSLHYPECNAHPNMKLKLQLFPINDGTRRALEMDKHNPYLELTLSTRKKISSVLEHLNKKWGNSSVACGELVLFPYSANGENLVGYQRWTQDSHVSAGDVYSSIGSPPLFRLRYGWFSHSKFSTMQAPPSCIPDRENSKEKTVDAVSISEPSISEPSTNYLFEKLEDPHRDCPTSVDNNHASAPHTASNDKNGFTATGPRNNLLKSSEPAANTSMHRKESGDNTNVQQLEHEGGLRLNTGSALSAGEWADSLTNVSVGDLLSEVPHEANLNCIEQPIAQSDQCLQQIPFSCDSFDAAIAAHISRHQSKMGFLSIDASHTSSIWDAEETCDAFSFQKNHSLRKEDPTSSTIAFPHIGKQMVRTSSMASDAFVEELPDIEGPLDYLAGGDPMDECPSDPQVMDTQAKDFNGLTDIYWPDSLGLLDLDIPSSKYHSEDLILSDSLGGLSHLIASSLDAFQNCSFLGLNKKDSSSTVNARENATFSDFKIGGEL